MVNDLGLTLFVHLALLGKRPRIWYNVRQLVAWQHILGQACS